MATPEDQHLLRLYLQPDKGTGTTAKLAMTIAEEITQAIFDAGMRPGDSLPNETAMLERLDVSRATLREALRVLETQGTIEIKTGRGGGPVVAIPNSGALARTMSANLLAIGVTFSEVLVTRETVEPTLAREAAIHRSDEQIDELKQLADHMERVNWDSPDFPRLNRWFHNTIAVASGNRPLAVLWSAISAIADGQGAGATWNEGHWNEGHWRDGNRAHRRIIAAIESGNCEAAQRAMWRHVDGFRQGIAEIDAEALDRPVKFLTERRRRLDFAPTSQPPSPQPQPPPADTPRQSNPVKEPARSQELTDRAGEG